MKRLTFLCIAAILLLSLSLPALALDALTNASFELPTLGNPTTATPNPARNVNFRTYTGADATAWAWGWWGNSAGYVRNGTANCTNPLNLNQINGLQWVSVDTGSASGAKYGGIKQEVTVTPGKFFYVDGWYRTKSIAAGSVATGQIWLFPQAPTLDGNGDLITTGVGAARASTVLAGPINSYSRYTNPTGLKATGNTIWVVTRFHTTNASGGADMHMDAFNLTSVTSPIPEPGTLVGLIGLSGMLGFVLRRRR